MEATPCYAATIIRFMEGFRDDYLPGLRTWDAFAPLLILRKMGEMHDAGARRIRQRVVAVDRHATHNGTTQAGAAQRDGRHQVLSNSHA
jgi:hypothetical protein